MSDLRFGQLAPDLLITCSSHKIDDSVLRHPDFLRNKSYQKAAQYSEFLEERGDRYNPTVPGPRQIQKKWSKFVIDFPGWRRRVIPTKQWEKYYARTCHFYFDRDSVTYWGYRRKSTNSGEDDAGESQSDEEDDYETLNDPWVVRERYKGGCAPRPGQKFDSHMGTQVVAPYNGLEKFRRVSKELDQVPGPNAQSRLTINAIIRELDELIEKLAKDSLMEEHEGFRRTTSPGAVSLDKRGSPPRSPAYDDMLVDPEQGEEKELSPPREAAQPSSKGADPAKANFAARLGVDLPPDVPPRPFAERLSSPSLAGSSSLEIKLLPPTREEKGKGVAQRPRFSKPRDDSGPGHSQSTGKHRGGVPFTLAVPRDAAHEFAPTDVSEEDRSLGWSYYDVGSIEEPLVWNKGGTSWAIAWVKQILDILKRPHMRALVTLGGPLAWIARRYRPNLIKEFMEGPSTQVAVHFKGWNDARCHNSWGLMADSVSESEKEILRGVVTVEGVSKALFPTNELCLSFFEHYSGENNVGFDRALHHIWREIDEGRPHPRSNQEMKGHLRRFHNGIYAPENEHPGQDDFEHAEAIFKTVFVISEQGGVRI
ncbi:hypothetical protein C8R46DRAFT_1232997 [Mycena filopes]|nr:hypothetical protein C8R46DRAFT_1232997 [Mycena filopes]